MAFLIPHRSPEQNLDAVVIGRAGMDLYPAPHGTKTAQADTFTSDLGGSAGNIAVALVRHGLRVGLAAPVTSDPVGQFVCNKLRHYGVEHLTPTPVTGVERTSLALAESRASDCDVVIYRNQAADFALSPDTFDLAHVDRAPMLIATGTALALEPSRTTTLAALTRSGCGVLDLDYRPYSWASDDQARAVYQEAIEASEVIIGNDEEFGRLGGSLAGGRAFAHALAQQREGRLVIYKMGGDGAVTFNGDQAFTTPIFPVNVLKPFGAGDAFMGGLLAAMCAGHGIESAVSFGSAAAAIVVSTRGCASAMPTKADVQAFIDTHNRG
ncbi:MAG: permease [Alphaproteobacteria bacterium TMED89]|nr:permease [Rhodospirillaceae bacterium]RPH12247.1 MAG: permease [Alphaproteobacteria bacterium TMED89]